VEFTSYRDHAAAFAVELVNNLDDAPDDAAAIAVLEGLLARHPASYEAPVTEADLGPVQRLRGRLREVFLADEERAAEILNGLLQSSGARPSLARHDGEDWHLHYASRGQPLASWLAAYGAMGLATVIADEGFDRLKVCEGERCTDVFIDLSKNRSRRYCSAAVCGNRASVAAYRLRKRAEGRPPHVPDAERV